MGGRASCGRLDILPGRDGDIAARNVAIYVVLDPRIAKQRTPHDHRPLVKWSWQHLTTGYKSKAQAVIQLVDSSNTLQAKEAEGIMTGAGSSTRKRREKGQE